MLIWDSLDRFWFTCYFLWLHMFCFCLRVRISTILWTKICVATWKSYPRWMKIIFLYLHFIVYNLVKLLFLVDIKFFTKHRSHICAILLSHTILTILEIVELMVKIVCGSKIVRRKIDVVR